MARVRKGSCGLNRFAIGLTVTLTTFLVRRILKQPPVTYLFKGRACAAIMRTSQLHFCRALGIPACYVCGYAAELQPSDFHGFFEAYLGERWYLFDPTRLAPVSGFVRIATGQDAADVPFATFIGAAQLKSKIVWANRQISSIAPPQFSDQLAVSTA